MMVTFRAPRTPFAAQPVRGGEGHSTAVTTTFVSRLWRVTRCACQYPAQPRLHACWPAAPHRVQEEWYTGEGEHSSLAPEEGESRLSTAVTRMAASHPEDGGQATVRGQCRDQREAHPLSSRRLRSASARPLLG
jgi:hypothetical protein